MSLTICEILCNHNHTLCQFIFAIVLAFIEKLTNYFQNMPFYVNCKRFFT